MADTPAETQANPNVTAGDVQPTNSQPANQSAATPPPPSSFVTAKTDEAKADAKAGDVKSFVTQEAKSDDKTKEQSSQTPKADGEKPKAEPAQVPEKYEFKVPEGATLNKELVAEFEKDAKELGLSQEKAQALFEKYGLKQSQDLVAKQQQEAVSYWENLRKESLKAIESDPIMGGNNLKETQAIVGRVYREVSANMPKEDREALDQLFNSGFGDMKPVASFLREIGQRFFREDKPMLDNTSSGGSERDSIGFDYDTIKRLFVDNQK